MFKRALTILAKERSGTWVILGLGLFVALALIFPAIPQTKLLAIAICLGCVAVVAIHLEIVRRRYISYNRRGAGIFIEVGPNGEFFGSGNPYWGQERAERHIFFCRTVPDQLDTIKVGARIQFPEPMSAYVEVTLIVTIAGPFVPRELCKTVIGQRQYSVGSWLNITFERAARDSAPMRQAMESYTVGHRGPDSIADALEDVLKEPPFSENPLSNISRVVLLAGVSSHLARREVDYS